MAANLLYRSSIQIPPATTQIKDSPLTHEEMDGNFKSLDLAIDEVMLTLSELTFTPTSISTFFVSGQNTTILETGTVVPSVSLTWALSGGSSSQTIDNNIGNIPNGITTVLAVGPFSTTQTWNLTVTSISPVSVSYTKTKTATLSFQQKRYWGVSTLSALTNSDILSLNSEFATTKSKQIVYDATGGRWLYYAYPASFGPLQFVSVNNFPFSDYSEMLITLTNSSGYDELYRLISFNRLQNGTSIPVVWS